MINATFAMWLLFLHAPVLHFHPKERFFPTYVEDAMSGIQGDPVLYGHVTIAGDAFRVVYYAVYFSNLEYMIVYVDRDNPAYVLRTYLSAHTFKQGTWVDGRVVDVYVARASHAHYVTPEVYVRVLGLFNDRCSGLGRRLDTRLTLELIANQWWTKRKKKIVNHASFNATKDPAAHGDSLAFRFFYPLTSWWP